MCRSAIALVSQTKNQKSCLWSYHYVRASCVLRFFYKMYASPALFTCFHMIFSLFHSRFTNELLYHIIILSEVCGAGIFKDACDVSVCVCVSCVCVCVCVCVCTCVSVDLFSQYAHNRWPSVLDRMIQLVSFLFVLEHRKPPFLCLERIPHANVFERKRRPNVS